MPALSLSSLLKPFAPPIRTARHYSFHKLRRDVVAGLTVSVVEVPQAMAYALIAGVPPQYGIYTSILQGIIGALLSSSEHLTTGPTNTQSLLIASAATRVASLAGVPVGGWFYVQLVFGLAVLKGLIQLAFAAANLGDLVRYVSRSVIVGVASGAGILIIVGQLPNILGVDISRTHSVLPGVIGSLARLLPHLGQANGRAIAIGLGCLAVVVVARRLSPLLPGALLAVVLGAVAVAAMRWSHGHIPRIEQLPVGVPHFNIPQIGWAEVQGLFTGAVALALLGMIESVSIVKAIAARTGERIVPNQEFFAQGLKNFITGFFQCIPGSGSFTRSALDHAAGAATRFAAVYNAVFVALIYWVFASQATYIPLASLAAVLLVIGYGLIDSNYIVRIARTSRSDAGVCIATLVATVLLPLEYAVFIGIFLNLGLYLRKAARLHMAEMIPSGQDRFVEVPLHDRSGGKQVMFLQIEGELFFGVADELQERLRILAATDVRVVIFRLKRTHSIDSTVLQVLEQFIRQMHQHHRHVILCGLRPETMRTIKAYGLLDLLGRQNVFETGHGIFTSARQALSRARELVGRSIDTLRLGEEDEDDVISYEI